ncbi:MAG: sigma-70 family RNA polymerase sigma factor [Phycisphaerales bacterium]|jgi:RNA polymerase sigma factor (sigma-70 family)
MRRDERIEIFDRLRAKHLPLLTAVLWRLSGDRELFAEAMQYALLGMWKHLEKLAGPAAHGYLYRIALSANSRAWRNRVGRDGQMSHSTADLCEESPPASDRAQLRQAVRRAIASLPIKQGRAIVMRYLEQQDYPAIASVLGCSEATARSHVSKDVASLRSRLTARVQMKEEWGDGEE